MKLVNKLISNCIKSKMMPTDAMEERDALNDEVDKAPKAKSTNSIDACVAN